MRKKLTILITLILVLTGCGKTKGYDEMMQTSLSRPLVTSQNKSKQFLKYYVLPDVGVKEATQLSSLFSISGEQVMMTLDVSDIIAREYYEQTEVKSRLEGQEVLYTEKGMYLDPNNVERNFVFTILEVGKKKAIVLENGIVTLIGVVADANLNYVLDAMVVTMRSTEVNESQVVAYYSNKEIINYKATHQDFFNHKAPESGTLLDIYNQMHPDDQIVVPSSEGSEEGGQ